MRKFLLRFKFFQCWCFDVWNDGMVAGWNQRDLPDTIIYPPVNPYFDLPVNSFREN